MDIYIIYIHIQKHIYHAHSYTTHAHAHTHARSQRLNQHLIANGIALLLVNPYVNDQWDYTAANESNNCAAQDCWDEQALDKQFFAKLFAEIHAGEYAGTGHGVLDMNRLMVWG